MLSSFFIASTLGWFIVGIFWLLPKKLALLRKVGNVTNDELIRMADTGNAEARKLCTLSKWYIGIGLFLLIPQVVLMQVFKIH